VHCKQRDPFVLAFFNKDWKERKAEKEEERNSTPKSLVWHAPIPNCSTAFHHLTLDLTLLTD